MSQCRSFPAQITLRAKTIIETYNAVLDCQVEDRQRRVLCRADRPELGCCDQVDRREPITCDILSTAARLHALQQPMPNGRAANKLTADHGHGQVLLPSRADFPSSRCCFCSSLFSPLTAGDDPARAQCSAGLVHLGATDALSQHVESQSARLRDTAREPMQLISGRG